MISRLGVLFMRAIAPLPLAWVRAMGTALGLLLYVLVFPRRRVVDINLRLCFPQWSEARRREVARQVFIRFAQSFLDRAWLWHADPEVVRRRIVVTGAVQEFAGSEPAIVFAPHFLGLDAGATGLTQQVARPSLALYTRQSNAVVDAWVLAGRARFGARLVSHSENVRELVWAVREGEVLYLLPDMNFGPEDSVFVPFYGVPAATVPSLSRLARLGRAKVIPVVTRMRPYGYEVQVHEAWNDFPTSDAVADTALMNRRLQEYINEAPQEYYWVHKRFKTRPPGEPSVY